MITPWLKPVPTHATNKKWVQFQSVMFTDPTRLISMQDLKNRDPEWSKYKLPLGGYLIQPVRMTVHLPLFLLRFIRCNEFLRYILLLKVSLVARQFMLKITHRKSLRRNTEATTQTRPSWKSH